MASPIVTKPYPQPHLSLPHCRILLLQEIAKKESTLVKEKRMYMQGWLKKVFVGQAVITTVLGGLMVKIGWFDLILSQ